MAMLGLLERIWLTYLTHFSKPACERVLYQQILRRGIKKVIEIGMGEGRRTQRMIQVARLRHPAEAIRYVGIDLFEARPPQQGTGLTLKSAHRMLKATGVRAQLLPGNPLTTLARVANGLSGFELLVVSAGWDEKLMARAWLYVPRVLADNSLVFVEQRDSAGHPPRLRWLCPEEIALLAEQAMRRRAA